MISEEKREKAESLLRYIDEHGDMPKGYTDDDLDILGECLNLKYIKGLSADINPYGHYRCQRIGERITLTESGKRFAYSSF